MLLVAVRLVVELMSAVVVVLSDDVVGDENSPGDEVC